MRRKIIPYEPYLKKLARKLRQDMTHSEVLLWNQLKNEQMMQYDFDRQKPISNYIVDFYCKDIKLAIEVDGATHDDELVASKDEIRESELRKLGVAVLRFHALDVVHDLVNVLVTIENWLLDYEDKFGVSQHVWRRRQK